MERDRGVADPEDDAEQEDGRVEVAVLDAQAEMKRRRAKRRQDE